MGAREPGVLGGWSTWSTSARTRVVVMARGKRVYTRTHVLIRVHIHTCTLTHKPCSRANNGHPEILILGTHMYPLTGKRGLRSRYGIKDLDLGA